MNQGSVSSAGLRWHETNPPETEQRLARRAEALEAAARLFESKGFPKTTVADVARSLGLGAPALYYYFPSKETLLFAVLERAMMQLNATLDQALKSCTSSDPAERLRTLVAAQVMEEVRAGKIMPMINDYLYGALRNAAHFSDDEVERLRLLQRHTVDLYRSILKAGQAVGRFPQIRIGAYRLRPARSRAICFSLVPTRLWQNGAVGRGRTSR